MKKPHTLRGYTLLEMIVSIGLFSVVMLIATGAYLVVISQDRRARATNDVVNNISFAVDSMARSLRTGSAYTCSGNPCTSIAFRDAQGSSTAYILRTDGTIGRCRGAYSPTYSCTSSAATSLTSDRVDIETLAFYTRGTASSASGDYYQPQVVLVVQGSIIIDADGETVDFAIETAATQRLIDL